MKNIIFIILILSSYLLANEKVTLELKWSHQFQFAGYYMAKEKGFYSDVGLDVTINERDKSKDNIKKVINQNATYGIADSILFMYKMQNYPVVLISPIFQHSPNVIFTRKDNKLNSAYKLENKLIMSYKNSADIFGIVSMFDELEIKPLYITKDLKFKNYELLLDNKIDGFVGYYTNESYYLKKANLEFNVINPTNYGVDLYGDMLFTSLDEARNYPLRVKKFKEASIKGWEYAINNIDETIKIIKNKYKSSKSIEHLKYEAKKTIQLINNEYSTIGHLDEGRVEFILKKYIKHKSFKNDIKIKEFFFEDLSKEFSVKKEEPLIKNKTLFSFEEKNYLKNKEKIKVCIDPNWLPFEKLLEDGNYIGVAANYIKLLESKINTKLEIQKVKTWQESMQKGKNKECDIFSLMIKTPKRVEYLDFAKPYLKLPYVIATRIDEFFINDISKLENDKKIGVVKEYASVELIRQKYPNLNLVEINSVEEGLEKVGQEKLFGVIDTLMTVGYSIQKKYIGEIKIAGKFNEEQNLGIAVRNDEPILLNIINKAQEIVTQEEKNNILKSWISISYDKKANYTTVIKWLVGISLVFGTIIFLVARNNKKLNEEILRRKKVELELKRYIALVDDNIITSRTNLEGEILDVSTAFCKASGFLRDEIIGKTHNLIKNEKEDKEKFKKIWDRLNNNQTWQGEILNKTKGGKDYWLQSFISPVFDENNKKIGFATISQNISNKKLLEEISITDELTRIYNRRFFNKMMPKILNTAKRKNENVCFCVLDIDYFKQYNDTYGHILGDIALKEVAQCINNSLHRADDYCFRLGGEEFGIVIKDLELNKTLEFIDKIRQHIENLKIEHKNNKASKFLTASFGVAIKNAKEIEDVDFIYSLADNCLYEAKRKGRNCVVSIY